MLAASDPPSAAESKAVLDPGVPASDAPADASSTASSDASTPSRVRSSPRCPDDCALNLRLVAALVQPPSRCLTVVAYIALIITLFLAIPTLIEVYRSPLSERRKWWARRPGQWNMATVVILNGLTWSGSLGFWVIALQYTTTTRASLLSCLYPLFLVIWMRYTGTKVSLGEIVGVVVSFAGLVITVVIPAFTAEETDPKTHLIGSAWVGDLMCVGVSVFLAIDVLLSAAARKVLPLFVYTTTVTIAVSAFMFLFALAGEGMVFDTSKTGALGWTTAEFLLMMLIFGFVVGMIGLLGFNLAVAYISPLIFSCVGLLDPAMTAVMSWIGGIEGLPSRSTFLGGTVALLGVLLVVVYEEKRKQREELHKASEAASSELDLGSTSTSDGDASGGNTRNGYSRVSVSGDDDSAPASGGGSSGGSSRGSIGSNGSSASGKARSGRFKPKRGKAEAAESEALVLELELADLDSTFTIGDLPDEDDDDAARRASAAASMSPAIASAAATGALPLPSETAKR